MNATSAWAGAKNLLCVRLDQLGDVLMTGPALQALKQAVPGRRITLLSSRSGALAARRIGAIDEVIVYDAPWVRHEAALDVAQDSAMIGRLRAQHFDGAVIFTVFSQNPLPAALFCRLAGIPLRLAHCRENPYQLLTDWIPEREPQQLLRHEVQRQLDLVAEIGAAAGDPHLIFELTPADLDEARGALAEAGVDAAQPWLLVHPGATAASRRYPVEHYAQAVRGLQQRLGWPVVFGGTADEAPLVEQLRGALAQRTVSLAGRLSLGGCAAAIRLARLLIANNSGPVHLAAAVGTPVVDLYALTNPQHTPWLVPHRVLYADVPCKYCYRSICPEGHHRCLREVAPERVVAAALELLAAERPHVVPIRLAAA